MTTLIILAFVVALVLYHVDWTYVAAWLRDKLGR